jgi:hypothetical protein
MPNWNNSALQKLRRLPAVLTIFLISLQIILPWSVPHFVTQDGPSHVYSALTARDVLIHRHSIQRDLYHFRPGILPNWTSTVLLAVIATLFGAANAERVMVDVCIVLGVVSFTYAARSFAGARITPTPLPNFLFHTWFLWLGFYNFSLGMALSLFALGYFVRNRRGFTSRQALALAAAIGLTFFTHLIPTAITVMAILAIALFTHGTKFDKPALRETGLALATVIPAIALTGLYVIGQPAVEWKLSAENFLAAFPPHIFLTAGGPWGGQILLVQAVMIYIGLAILLLRPSEWRSEKGALFLVMLACLVLYFVVPDEGLGGAITRIRFVWPVFILGGLLAASSFRRPLEIPFAICIAVLLTCNLFVTWKALQLTSRGVEDYIAATDRIPANAIFVRIRFPTLTTNQRYDFIAQGRDPFLHLDAYSAARRGSIDLSDYEAVNAVFPLTLRPKIGENQRSSLWAMEGPGEDVAESLKWLSATLPVPIDYVVLVSEPPYTPGLARLNTQLESEMKLFAKSSDGFVKVYQRPVSRKPG